MALTEKLHKRFVSIVFVLGLLLWLQGNILVWNYGIIGKGEIDLTKDVWRGWVDTSVWVGLFALAVFLYKYFYRIARPASIALVTLEAVVLLFNSFQHPGIWKRGIDYSKPQKEIYEFSSKQNVIHVILDEFQSAVFQKIISADTAYYYNVFDGFTFFKETVSSFPSTMTSVPSIMSGKVYKNDIPITDFIDSVYDGKTIPNVLYDNGYDVDLAAPIDWYDKGQYTNWYYIPVPYGVSLQDYQRSNSVFMMSLVAFRCAPHFLKKELFNKISTVSSFSRQGSESYEVLSHYANENFLQDMIHSMSVKRDKPLYKFFHLTTTHYPAVVNANCQYAGGILPWDWKNITVQAKCSLDHFIEFLNKLKSLGIYDSSLIILHADHGYYKLYGSKDEISIRNFDKQDEKEYYDEENFAEKVCSCSPLLAVKPPHTNGLLKISNAQTALTDIPSTITSLLHIDAGFTGKSVFDIDPNENRERRFNYYYTLYGPGRKYFETMDEYSIIGSLYDRLSWHLVARHFPPTGLSGTEKIDLGTNDSYRFLQTGWSYREKERSDTGRTYTWALGKSAIISLTLPKNRDTIDCDCKITLQKWRTICDGHCGWQRSGKLEKYGVVGLGDT